VHRPCYRRFLCVYSVSLYSPSLSSCLRDPQSSVVGGRRIRVRVRHNQRSLCSVQRIPFHHNTRRRKKRRDNHRYLTGLDSSLSKGNPHSYSYRSRRRPFHLFSSFSSPTGLHKDSTFFVRREYSSSPNLPVYSSTILAISIQTRFAHCDPERPCTSFETELVQSCRKLEPRTPLPARSPTPRSSSTWVPCLLVKSLVP
jgi:hypothetical protein